MPGQYKVVVVVVVDASTDGVEMEMTERATLTPAALMPELNFASMDSVLSAPMFWNTSAAVIDVSLSGIVI